MAHVEQIVNISQECGNMILLTDRKNPKYIYNSKVYKIINVWKKHKSVYKESQYINKWFPILGIYKILRFVFQIDP